MATKVVNKEILLPTGWDELVKEADAGLGPA
jgi:hypothetical protein